MKIAYYDIIDGKSVPVDEETAKKRDQEWIELYKDFLEEMENTKTADEYWKIIESSNISKENKSKLKEFIYGGG